MNFKVMSQVYSWVLSSEECLFSKSSQNKMTKLLKINFVFLILTGKVYREFFFISKMEEQANLVEHKIAFISEINIR